MDTMQQFRGLVEAFDLEETSLAPSKNHKLETKCNARNRLSLSQRFLQPRDRDFFPRLRIPDTRHLKNVIDEEEDDEAEAEFEDENSRISGFWSSTYLDDNVFMTKEELTDENEDLRRQLESLRALLTEKEAQIASIQPKVPNLYDDTYFIEKWDALRTMITSWSETFFLGARGGWHHTTRQTFQNLGGIWKQFLVDPYRRPKLIEARIWSALQEYLFTDVSLLGLINGGKRRFSVGGMLAAVSSENALASQRLYLEWRARTFAQLFPGKGPKIEPSTDISEELATRIHSIYRKVWDSLWRYAGYDIRGKKSAAKKMLRTIVSMAFHLDIDMHKYPFSFNFSSANCVVDGTVDSTHVKEVSYEEGSGFIRLIVTPPLYKVEYSEGDAERVKQVLMRRARVCTSGVWKEQQNQSQTVKVTTQISTLDHSETTSQTSGRCPSYHSHSVNTASSN